MFTHLLPQATCYLMSPLCARLRPTPSDALWAGVLHGTWASRGKAGPLLLREWAEGTALSKDCALPPVAPPSLILVEEPLSNVQQRPGGGTQEREPMTRVRLELC